MRLGANVYSALLCRPRSAASASTWSLERLDALAAEVAALLDRQLAEQQQPQQPHTSGQHQQAVDQHIAGQEQRQGGEQQQQQGEQEQQLQTPQQRHQQQGQEEGSSGAGGLMSSGHEAEREAGQGEREGLGQVAEPHTPGRPEGAVPPAAPQQQQHQGSGGERAHDSNSDSSSSSSSTSSSSSGSSGSGSTEAPLPIQVQLSSSFDFEEEQEQLLERIASSQPGAVGSSRSRGRGGGSGSSGDEDGAGAGQQQQYYGAAWPTDTGPGWADVGPRRRADLYRRYPVQTLTAVNTVLFDRHGYQPCNRYGVPRWVVGWCAGWGRGWGRWRGKEWSSCAR